MTSANKMSGAIGEFHKIEELQTPCYVIDEEKYVANLEGFRNAIFNAWGRNALLGYSVKTNPASWMIQKSKELGYYAEVVSDQEYLYAKKLGFKENEIIFNGPIKGKECLFDALTGGSIVNVDSKREIAWIEESQLEIPVIKIGIRVNLNLDKLCPGESRTGAAGSRFGFSLDDGELEQAIDRLKEIKGVEICGLHLHVNSLTRNSAVYRKIAEYAGFIAGKFNLELQYVDIGGGFYGGYPNLHYYEEYASEISNELKKHFSPRSTYLIIEPGGSIQATPVDFYARVVDVKTISKQKVIVSEASRVWLDPTMSKNSYKLDVVSAGKSTRCPTQLLCGFTCMDTDRLMELKDETELSAGDIIRFKMVGAYTYSFNPTFFIETRPAIYVSKGPSFFLVEKRSDPSLVQGVHNG